MAVYTDNLLDNWKHSYIEHALRSFTKTIKIKHLSSKDFLGDSLRKPSELTLFYFSDSSETLCDTTDDVPTHAVQGWRR